MVTVLLWTFYLFGVYLISRFIAYALDKAVEDDFSVKNRIIQASIIINLLESFYSFYEIIDSKSVTDQQKNIISFFLRECRGINLD